MEQRREVKVSKFLSLVLRHNPEKIGIVIDNAGWVRVDCLLAALAKHGMPLTMSELQTVVEQNSKKRFAFNEDETMIRASQGHSVNVSLEYESIQPPTILYHGTPQKNVERISKEGLRKMERHHVHLSLDVSTAQMVGSRRGNPAIYEVAAGKMYSNGFVFYRSDNGVWLTDNVPPEYLKLLAE